VRFSKRFPTATIITPESVAPQLSAKEPYFQMRSGGIYAVALSGGKPSHFVRVDKDRRSRRERKRARRTARMLAEATI